MPEPDKPESPCTSSSAEAAAEQPASPSATPPSPEQGETQKPAPTPLGERSRPGAQSATPAEQEARRAPPTAPEKEPGREHRRHERPLRRGQSAEAKPGKREPARARRPGNERPKPPQTFKAEVAPMVVCLVLFNGLMLLAQYFLFPEKGGVRHYPWGGTFPKGDVWPVVAALALGHVLAFTAWALYHYRLFKKHHAALGAATQQPEKPATGQKEKGDKQDRPKQEKEQAKEKRDQAKEEQDKGKAQEGEAQKPPEAAQPELSGEKGAEKKQTPETEQAHPEAGKADEPREKSSAGATEAPLPGEKSA